MVSLNVKAEALYGPSMNRGSRPFSEGPVLFPLRFTESEILSKAESVHLWSVYSQGLRKTLSVLPHNKYLPLSCHKAAFHICTWFGIPGPEILSRLVVINNLYL